MCVRQRDSVFIETEVLGVAMVSCLLLVQYRQISCQFRGMTTDLVLMARGCSKRPSPVATAAKHLP